MSPITANSVTPAAGALLFCLAAVASGINSVAGGGSLISFPALIGFGIPPLVANATNSVGLWPGSLSGAVGFLNYFQKTKKYLFILAAPTILGSMLGAFLLTHTPESAFNSAVPILILLAAALLFIQPKIKAFQASHHITIGTAGACVIQFLVSVYGGYFGAGMGIMMLASFVMYMDGNIHELNAVKAWLGVLINFTCSFVFLTEKMVWVVPGLVLVAGSIVGGYAASRVSQKVDPEVLRKWIAGFGFAMAILFAMREWGVVHF